MGIEQNWIGSIPLPSLLLECPLSDEFALGFELVEIVDSAGEDALESWAKLSRNVAVSPSVKLFRRLKCVRNQNDIITQSSKSPVNVNRFIVVG